jgi:plasmid stabilization system protein ParE
VNVSFNPLAEREPNDAAGYYELESPVLGAAFLTEAQRCCDGIAEYPEAGHIVIGSIRRRLVRRFPYAIVPVQSRPITAFVIFIEEKLLAARNRIGREPLYGESSACGSSQRSTLRARYRLMTGRSSAPSHERAHRGRAQLQRDIVLCSPVRASPSSRGLGRGPFKAKTRVRIPLGTPSSLLLAGARTSASTSGRGFNVY